MRKIPPLKLSDRIPTRYDDITKEIQSEKFKNYFEQQTKPTAIEEKTYQLGSKIGEALRALTLGGK